MGWFGRKEHDEEQLSAYIDGELSPREAEIVERHLSTCNSCAALLEELSETKALLSQLPAQTPRRSFVLGAEYARTPVREGTRRPKLSLALAPAAALSVFVALVLVDLAGTSTSSDETANTFTAASAPQEADASSAGGAALTQQMESAGASQDAVPPAVDNATGDDGAKSPPAEGAAGSSAAEAPVAPELRSAGPEPTPGEGATMMSSADQPGAEESPGQVPAPEPLAFEGPAAEDDGGGISTLRVLQVLAGVAFLASGFYVFVWPRVSRGGSPE